MEAATLPTESDSAFLAYEATAAHYDRLTAHHDYDLWLGNLLPALRSRGLEGRRLLDVACGTGKSFLPMLARNWEVTGVDLSPAMLARACTKAGTRARLLVGDMRALPTLGSYDLVWCLDDALNYVLSVTELEACFTGFRRNLAVNGLCLFDVSALAMYRGFFAENTVIEDTYGRLSVLGQESSEFPAGAQAVALVEVLDEHGEFVQRVTHRQRHFPAEVIVGALERTGWRCLDVFGHGYDAVLQQPLDERIHTKAVFIAKRDERR
jgi:SAM-dependent methyltransferase